MSCSNTPYHFWRPPWWLRSLLWDTLARCRVCSQRTACGVSLTQVGQGGQVDGRLAGAAEARPRVAVAVHAVPVGSQEG